MNYIYKGLYPIAALFTGLTPFYVSGVLAEAETPLQIYQQAINNDPSLRIADTRISLKKENQSLSRGGLYPEIGLTAAIARNREDVETEGVGTSGLTYFDSNNVQLKLKQSLYNKENHSKIDSADAEFKVAESEHKIAQQQIIMQVTEAYFEVLFAQDNLSFANVEKQTIAEQLENIKRRYKVGKSTVTDLQEAQASYDLSAAQAILTQDQYNDALDGLTLITGSQHTEIARLSPTFKPTALEPANLDHWVNAAVENNLQMKATNNSILALNHEVQRQRANYYPTLDLVAKYRIEETGGRFGETDTEDGSIGLELDIPIYNGGQTSSRVRTAHLKQNEAKFNLQKTRRSVIRETRKSYRAVMTSVQRINALQQAVISTQAAVNAVTKGYKIGTRTGADVLVAQRELYKAKRDYSADRYRYILNFLQLKNITGSLNKDDISSISKWFD